MLRYIGKFKDNPLFVAILKRVVLKTSDKREIPQEKLDRVLQLHNLVNASPVLITFIELNEEDQDFVYLVMNQCAANHLSKSIDQIVGIKASDIFPQEGISLSQRH